MDAHNSLFDDLSAALRRNGYQDSAVPYQACGYTLLSCGVDSADRLIINKVRTVLHDEPALSGEMTALITRLAVEGEMAFKAAGRLATFIDGISRDKSRECLTALADFAYGMSLAFSTYLPEQLDRQFEIRTAVLYNLHAIENVDVADPLGESLERFNELVDYLTGLLQDLFKAATAG